MDPLLIYTKTIKLDATQVDAFGRMRPSALLEITQEAAGEHANLLGVGRDALGSHGLFWAIVRQVVHIHRMPLLGQTVHVTTWPGPAGRTAFPRYVRATTPEGEALFEAVALWLFMNRETRAMVLPAASGVQVPGQLLGMEMPLPTGIAPRQYDNRELRRVRFSELDCNGHLSNTKYANWLEDLLPGSYHRDHTLERLHICYLNEALEGQDIALHWTMEDGSLALEATRDLEDGKHRVFALRAQYKTLS